MDTTYIISVVLFMILLPASVVLEILQRSSNSIPNSDFDGYEILESEIVRVKDFRLDECCALCTEMLTCLSFNYNKISQTCVLFDKDFTDLSTTTSQMIGDWLYYYLIRDVEMRSPQCSAPSTTDVCSLFCLYYIHIYNINYTQFESICNAYDGGEMVIVDRQLKQHCVQDLMVRQSHHNNVYIQGKRNETTNIWAYNDGKAMTFFNWKETQLENRANETFIGLKRSEGYLWDDVYDDASDRIHATVCQQT